MKRVLFKGVLSAALMGACAMQAAADYPIVSQRYLADPSSLVTPDEVYIYCSDDDTNALQGGYNISDVVCVSSRDMKNWTDHGVVFTPKEATTWANKSWAPCAATRDGKYYLYFGNGGANIGVVVGDSPTGPFKDEIGKPLLTGNTPGVQPARNMWLFDPAVFIDDDGQAYVYFGGNGDDNVRAAKLNKDMMSLDGDVIKMHADHFFEASWVFKRGDTYYFSYSTTPQAQMRIDYQTSTKPIEGFTYAGIVAEQPPKNNNNNHAAQFKFKDNWYHVYHNRIVANEAGIPTTYKRNIALEQFGFNNDGTIRKAEFTTDGVKQIGHLNPYERVEGETMAGQKGIETEPCEAGGMDVTDTQNGDWTKIAGVDFGGAGASKVQVRTASEADSKIEFHLDSPDGPRVATVAVQPTGGAQSWKTLEGDVTGATGVHDLYLKFVGGEGNLAKVDWWQFTAK